MRAPAAFCPANGEVTMSEDKKQLVPLEPEVDGFDGFTDEVEGQEAASRAGAVIQGTKIAFTNEATWVMHNDEQISPKLEFIAVDIARVVQKWVDNLPVETRVLGPGEKVPDLIALNEAIPRSQWGKDPGGHPRAPWQFQYVVYLLDPITLDRFSYPTGTTGGKIAVHDLKDKTQWMRKFRGEKVCAVVTLADTFMKTQYGGRQRPHFIIQRWVRLGGGGEQPALAAPENSPTLPGLEVVAEPTMSEQMKDEIVFDFDDSPDINVPKPTAAPVRPKPAASPTTKKGVQKIAAGRGR
jgi:hypothetical protein